MLETMEILQPYTTEDMTVGTKGLCQHDDEPLPHSRNSQTKEYDQSEDRKSSMNSNFGNRRPEFANVRSGVRSIKLEMIQSITLLRNNLVLSIVAAPLISTFSRLDRLFFLVIDNSADQKVRKSMNFLTLGMKGYNNLPCKGIQGSKRFHSMGGLLRSKVLNSEGLRQWYRESHIEGLQISEIVHSAGPRKPDKSPYMSKSKAVNSAGEPKPDNFSSYRTEGLHRSKTWQDESLNRSQTLHSECLQTSDELYSHSFNDATHPPFEGTRGINSVLQNALQAFILQISMLLKIAGKYRHVVILIVFLTRAACTDIQEPINCTRAVVITSPDYPATYPPFEHVDWFVTAPEGRMILVTFNNFSLGSSDDVNVVDTDDDRHRQYYSGQERRFTPFLSRRNSLAVRFNSQGAPTGSGFNISASCFDLPGTRVGRLMGGNTSAEGFLELQAESGAQWMRVCDDPPADRLADVVCGELGFPGAKEVSYEQGGCSLEGAHPDCIRAPSCGKYAYRSQDCTASPENCTSSLAVKVKCFEPGFEGCYDLSNTKLQNRSSYESTSECITSCRADTSQAIAIINGSECFCSTTDDIVLLYPIKDQSCDLHQLVYNASVGFCNQPDDVMNGTWESDATWFGSIVTLKCDAGYSLNGIGTLQCVTKVPSYLPVWNDSIPTCKKIAWNDGQNNAVIPISTSLTALLFVIICAVVWKCRKRKIHKQRSAPSTTATRESDLTNRTRALPQPPIDESLPTILLNRSQHVTRTTHNLNNSSTLHPSLELTALQHGNNNYASGNPYHYAISMTNSHQATPNMGTDVNAYEPEDMSDQNTINAGHRTEMMPMINRPLPHRPISVGVREGPSLPPRERRGIHSSTLSPNLTQNTRSDNSYYSADDFKHDDVHNGSNFPLSPLPSKLNPFYHCLEDDDQQMCSNDCDTDVLINNESNAHDDNLADVMVDNVLYNPMDF